LSQLQIVRTREAPPQAEQIIRVAPLSIQPGWLDRFRSDPARSFLKATFDSWCLIKTGSSARTIDAASRDSAPSDSPKPSEPAASVVNGKRVVPAAAANAALSSAPVILATLSTGDPLLLETRCGEGFVLLMTTSLDRSWTDLPTRSDFVPFLHEAVFHAASSRSHRNVDFGEPLIARLGRTVADARDSDSKNPEAADLEPGGLELPSEPAEDFATFVSPGGGTTSLPVTARSSNPAGSTWSHADSTVVFSDTFTPGVYGLAMVASADYPEQHDGFVVNYDHSEDDLTQLAADDKARLATNDRVRFSSSLEDLAKRMYGDESITELWAVLLTLFLIFLIIELFLTRRAIRKGYGNDTLISSP
jgi:hypothetical protein